MLHLEIDQQTKAAWEERLLNLQNSYKESLTALENSEAINYKRGIAESCKNLGYCYWRFSDFSLSLSHSLRAIKIFQNLNDLKGEADTLNNIGAVYMFQNDNEKRLEVNLRCKKIREKIGDLEGVSSSEGNIGETYFEMGDYKNAEMRFHSVLKNPNASTQGLAWANHNLGLVENVYKNYDKALEYYTKGLDLSYSVQYSVLITDSYLRIAELFIELNDLDNAIANAEKALESARESGAKEGEKRALYFLSKSYEKKKLFETSLKYHKDYHAIDMEISRDTEMERLKTTQLRVAFNKIEEQKNELLDSIRYAEQIQKAVLTRHQSQDLIGEYFLFFQAKDIVSGDFYWYYEKDEFYYMCVADCTGHGVPGAFLTMLGTTYLNEIMTLEGLTSPGQILDKLREHFILGLSQNTNTGNKDGMDISMIRLNTKTLEAEWSGANNPIWIVRKNNLPAIDNSKTTANDTHSLFEIKGDIQSISIMDNMQEFKNHQIQLLKDDRIYLFSDGYTDQFGGENGKKFMTTNFKKEILAHQHFDINTHGEKLKLIFDEWKGQNEQVDDVCVLGIEI